MQPGMAKSAGALIDEAVRGEGNKVVMQRPCKGCPELGRLILPSVAKLIAARDKRIIGQQARTAELQLYFKVNHRPLDPIAYGAHLHQPQQIQANQESRCPERASRPSAEEVPSER